MSTSSPAVAPKRSFSIVRVLLVIIPALLIAGAWYLANTVQSNPTFGAQDWATQLGHMVAASQEMSTEFADGDGDLVADAPMDAAKQLAPDTLVFSFIGGTDAEEGKDQWKEFADFLAKKTGKKVEVTSYEKSDDQLDELKEGKLHVTAFNTGSVQEAVNTGGFVPVGTRGANDGSFGYTMKIIVPAKSSVKELTDLKGKTIKFTERNSHSGCKAAVVKLKDAGLIVERDYQPSLSTSHDTSIAEISTDKAEAAAVASDLLQRAEAEGKISVDQYRTIYESEKFPPFAIGYAYNLSPELAEKVRAALLEFPWAGTGLEKQFAGTDATKFVPLNYKDDFAVIRKIDESLAKEVKSTTVANKK
jgi:phosphonate transport system substrate-binding protein